jgi:uncharacterized membrane protein
MSRSERIIEALGGVMATILLITLCFVCFDAAYSPTTFEGLVVLFEGAKLIFFEIVGFVIVGLILGMVCNGYANVSRKIKAMILEYNQWGHNAGLSWWKYKLFG